MSIHLARRTWRWGEEEIAAFVEMLSHGVANSEISEGRVVLSRLPAGESSILSTSLALKLVIEGEEVHEIDGRPFVLQPGRMLLVDCGSPYRTTIRNGRNTLGLCVYLPWSGDRTLAEIPMLGRASMRAVDGSDLGRFVRDAAVRLHRARDQTVEAADLIEGVCARVAGAMESASSNIGRVGLLKTSTKHGVLNRLECARAFLHQNLDRSVPLSELATIVGMSSFQLVRYFSDAYGAPPSRYHRNIRLEDAQRRLKLGDMSISEVALQAGYSDLSAFSHSFRRRFGQPPNAVSRLARLS